MNAVAAAGLLALPWRGRDRGPSGELDDLLVALFVRPPLVVLGGAGSGKTVLLDHLVGEALHSGDPVVVL